MLARNHAVNPDLRQRTMAILRNPAWTSFTWFGMTAGVSLLATPLRFGAETITRAVALDVGRVVFNGLNKAEFVALIIVLVQLRVSGHTRALWIPVFALALILITQASWLLPELSSRTDIVIAGGEPPPSIAHAAYSALELLKLTLLAYTGFRALQLLR
jgi:hypothetical protein